MVITQKKQFIFGLVSALVAGTSFFSMAFAQEATTTATSSETGTTTPAASGGSDLKIDTVSVPDGAVGDYVVGPGKVEVTVAPGETVTRYISLTNRVSSDRTFEMTVEDMSGSADGTEAVVLLGDQKGPYSMRDYISFPTPMVTLDLGERVQLPVTITMPPNAEPGGYYGAVLVSTVQESESEVTGAPRSPIVARVGTLFFITVPGEAERASTLVSFDTINSERWFQSGPIDLQIVHENTGSVHLNPYGEVSVTNMLGEQVGFVELEPWFVLPKAMRLREISWDRELLFGRYTFTAKINRGYDNVIDESSLVIWVLPWKFLAAGFVALFLVTLLVRLFFSTFEFKRRGP